MMIKKYPCPNCDQELGSSEELDKHTTLEKIREGDLIQISNGASIYFKDTRLVCPALDCNPDHNLILTVPFTGVRTIEGSRGKVTKNIADTILVCVTDASTVKDKLFEATQDNFLERGWLARIPNPIIEQRWSMKGIVEYVYANPVKATMFEAYSKIKERFDYYVDFGSTRFASELCAVYCLATYFYFLFEYFPYIKFGGEKGSAKSKAGSIFQALAFNATMSANQTPSAIFRFAQDSRGCLVIDEAENLAYKSEEMQALNSVLLSGWQRNGHVLRTNKDTLRPEKFSTFGPKVICSILPLWEVLEDRSFEIILLKTRNNELSDREPSLHSSEWQEIRDCLYSSLFQNWKTVRTVEQTIRNELNVRGRFWNLAKSLLTLARCIDQDNPGEGLERKIVEFLKDQQSEKESKALSSLTGSVIESLEQLLKEERLSEERKDYEFRILVQTLAEKVRELEGDSKNEVTGKYSISSKRITAILTNLKLYKDPKRAGTKGGYAFLVSLSQIEDVRQRLSLTSERKSQPSEVAEHSESTEGVKQRVEGVQNDSSAVGTPDSSASSESSVSKKNFGSVLQGDVLAFDFAQIGCHYQVNRDDFRDSKLGKDSIDLILTDPPYALEYLDLWDGLGKLASNVLKPGGFLVAYGGTFTYEEEIKHLKRCLSFKEVKHLKLIGLRNDGYKTNVNDRPVLIFYKEPLNKRDLLSESFEIESGAMDKRYHEWGQPVSEFVQILKQFSKEGDLILEPFAGGGTTIQACIETKRNCVAYEIKKEHFETMRNRFLEFLVNGLKVGGTTN